jgi:membrane associated rhomboid family serine protease
MMAHFYAAGYVVGVMTPILFHAVGWWNLVIVGACGACAGWLAAALERRS